MRQVSVLQTLTLLQVHQLCDALTEETYEAGQNIITQGEVRNEFACLVRGEGRVIFGDGGAVVVA